MLLTIRVPSSITPGMNFGDDKMWSIIEGRMSKPPCTPSRSFRMSVLSSILALLNRMLSMAGKDSQINEPVHKISNNLVCATSKGSDQPAHTRRLIRAFACRLNIL